MKSREQWSSNFGFLMAAAGSAVGLGNLWKFPYLAGSNGGALFLIFYFVILIAIGAPILLMEMSVGRRTQLNAIGACKKLNKNWGFVGVIGTICAFVVLSYYSIIGGWVIKYIVTYITQSSIENPTEYFTNFSSSATEPIVYHLIFMALTVIIVLNGISNGIEKVSKIFLPVLLVILLGIAIYSLTLPNAIDGIKFFIVPDFSQIESTGDIATIFINAMGQVFFSLSIGMGTLITYGSYLNKNTNLQKNALFIPLIDTAVAILAGFAILPAVFSFNLEPSAGPGLLFQTLPHVFANLPAGKFLGILFFVLVFFAAITSAISLLEVVTAYLIDRFKWSRPVAAFIPALGMFILGSIASLSFGNLSSILILNMSIFDFLTFLTDKILMPLGGFFLAVLVGYIWGIPNMLDEISSNGMYKIHLSKTISFMIKVGAPIMILVIVISSFF